MKIGFVSLPLSGHLYPMTALARKLQTRGHEVVFFGVLDIGPTVRAAGLDFVPYCEKEYPAGSIAEALDPIAKLRGLAVLQYTHQNVTPGLARAAFEHLPGKLAETGVEAMVIDSVHRFVELVPMAMGIPYVQIWNILPIDFSGSTPPCVFNWPHEDTPEARKRNIEGVKQIGAFMAPVLEIAKSYVEKIGLPIVWSDRGATTSKLAVITQTPKEFDLPGVPWPPQFHYTGPFHDNEGREPVPFPWDKLTCGPMIYASLGTLVNGLDHVYATILAAVAELPKVQLVLSIGKNVDPDNLGPIPPNAIVVSTAPQIQLLKRAALSITHAGLNTALESLAQGVPLVALPIAYDQPGVANRIAHHGVGESLDLENLTADRLLELILKVLRNPRYGERARYFQEVIARTRGLDLAADIIEQAFKKNQAEEAKPQHALLA